MLQLDEILLADGTIYKNPQFFRSLEEKLAKVQRVFSKRINGSSRWNKQQVKIARIHEYMTNARRDYLEKISTEIIKNHNVIRVS